MSDERFIDLDAARIGRWEALGVEVRVRHGGKDWRLVPELPLQFAVATIREDVTGMIGLLLVDPDEAPDFLQTYFSLNDLRVLLTEVYGVQMGGIFSLGALLQERWEEAEADLQSTYRLDLRVMGVRRAVTMIRQLPPESRVGGGWSMQDELVATHLEITHELWRWFVAVNSKGHKFPSQLHLPRPRRKGKPRRRQASMTEAVAQIAAIGVPIEVVPVGGGD